MAHKYAMWGDVNNVPFMTLNKGKFTCILKSSLQGNYLDGFLSYTCAYNEDLTSVSFPNLTTISNSEFLNHTFYRCPNLTSVSFPKLTAITADYVMDSTFGGCPNLTSVSFPKLTTVTNPATAFYYVGHSSLTIHLPKVLSSLGIKNASKWGSNNNRIYYLTPDLGSFVYDL